MANLGDFDRGLSPLLALARTRRARFVVAATRQKIEAITPGGEVVATGESPGSVRTLTADGEGQGNAMVVYAATENGVFSVRSEVISPHVLDRARRRVEHRGAGQSTTSTASSAWAGTGAVFAATHRDGGSGSR